MPDMSLLITCHPAPASLCGAIARLIEETLRARNVTVVVDDLHAIGFDPVIPAAELKSYFDPGMPGDIAGLAANLQAARELIFVLPVWMYDMPAILKGYFDRVWRPQVSFELVDGQIVQLLTGIERLTVIATHGRGKAETDLIGDGTRDFFARSLPSALPGLRSNTRFDFYALDIADTGAIEVEFAAVRRHFA